MIKNKTVYGKLPDRLQTIIFLVAFAILFPTLFIENISLDIALLFLGISVTVSALFHFYKIKYKKNQSGFILYIFYGFIAKKINSSDLHKIDYTEENGKCVVIFVTKNEKQVKFYASTKEVQTNDSIKEINDYIINEEINNFHIQEKIFDYSSPDQVPTEFLPYYYLVWIDSEVDNGGYSQLFDNKQWGVGENVVAEISQVAPTTIIENFKKARKAYLQLNNFSDLLEKFDFDCDRFATDYPKEYKKYSKLEKELSDCDTKFYEYESELLATFEEFDKKYRAEELKQLSKN